MEAFVSLPDKYLVYIHLVVDEENFLHNFFIFIIYGY